MRSDDKFQAVIYLDTTSYNYTEVLERVRLCKEFIKWAYVVHDKDIEEDGTPKKPHIHIICKLCNKNTPQAFAYMIGVPLSAVANLNNWRSMCRYLTHIDYPNKAPYSIADVASNFQPELEKIVSGLSDDAGAKIIWNYILENNGVVDKYQFVSFVLDNGLWAQFRRGFAIWNKFLKG